MKCVVGLGNPGRRYTHTRHNAGFMVLSSLGARLGASFRESGFSDVAQASLSANGAAFRVLLVKPGTFMNLSGQAVAEVTRYYGLSPDDLLVIHDDLDLPFGKIRIKRSGSAGGHKGVESIIERLDTEAFPRIKLGVGRPPEGEEAVDYVLDHFSLEELKLLPEVIELASTAVLDVLTKGLEAAMADYNGREP